MIVENEIPTIYVIDDDASVRDALKDLFASVGLGAETFASAQEFIHGPPLRRPACLVLDVRMPDQSGVDFHRRMADLGLDLPVIFITGHGDIAMGVKAIKDGAADFLTKPFRDHDLLEAVQQALGKDRHYLHERKRLSDAQDRWRTLSTGEREVFERVAQGLLNKQIAVQLNVQEVTVKVRRARVMRKMGATSLADLVRIFDALTPTRFRRPPTGD